MHGWIFFTFALVKFSLHFSIIVIIIDIIIVIIIIITELIQEQR